MRYGFRWLYLRYGRFLLQHQSAVQWKRRWKFALHQNLIPKQPSRVWMYFKTSISFLDMKVRSSNLPDLSEEVHSLTHFSYRRSLSYVPGLGSRRFFLHSSSNWAFLRKIMQTAAWRPYPWSAARPPPHSSSSSSSSTIDPPAIHPGTIQSRSIRPCSDWRRQQWRTMRTLFWRRRRGWLRVCRGSHRIWVRVFFPEPSLRCCRFAADLLA